MRQNRICLQTLVGTLRSLLWDLQRNDDLTVIEPWITRDNTTLHCLTRRIPCSKFIILDFIQSGPKTILHCNLIDVVYCPDLLISMRFRLHLFFLDI